MNIKIFILAFILAIAAGLIISCSTNENIGKHDRYPVTYTVKYGVRGVIFADSIPVLPGLKKPEFLKGRFTPNKDDIILFERIFHSKYSEFMANKYYPSNTSPFSFTDWVRQYYGFYNEKGEKILWVFFIKLDLDSRKMWRKGPYFQIPGAWGIVSNLETQKLVKSY